MLKISKRRFFNNHRHVFKIEKKGIILDVRLSIVIPVYNEKDSLETILDTVNQVKLIADLEKEFILIDDCSTDGSFEIAQKYQSTHPEMLIKVLRLEKNSGKGAALRAGFRASSGDFIIIQDADLEYDPNEYNEILKTLVEGRADVVYGSRFTGTKPRRSVGFLHYWANKFLTYLSNIANNLYLTDMETCYKAFSRKVLEQINLTENRFGIEPEITAKIARIKRIRIYEVPISYHGRDIESGKKIRWTDGFKAIFYIIKYGFFKA
jgi:glycosyltransferase involved in cell wall biosynthesis